MFTNDSLSFDLFEKRLVSGYQFMRLEREEKMPTFISQQEELKIRLVKSVNCENRRAKIADSSEEAGFYKPGTFGKQMTEG